MSAPGTRSGRLVATAPVRAHAFRAFEALSDRDLNFRPIRIEQAAQDPGWHLDHRRASLLPESPGSPLRDGAFQTARQLLVSYSFADPSVVRAVYDPTSEFDGRNLLLVGRFFGLRFHLGVRIGGVQEETDEDAQLHRFRWHYRTLEGHLERGHMSYELRKDLETGDIEFRMLAYSQRADIDNPLVRLGFVMFGRRVQLRFYDRSLARMQTLVAQNNRTPGHTETPTSTTYRSSTDRSSTDKDTR